ncbi:M24 family metallopeptidase [Steroidobacter sp.]|uniref:M24 family metallopeptidase n=1 Tax=Steroidobacter sp. TaxID=1978227 RepID=UPI001A3D6173|nr:Xaa-Pro peptidase family protein [Steroidobacter sp.]MBL8268878.1 aminopeptidase P family protein [Steroidobacter sp.]
MKFSRRGFVGAALASGVVAAHADASGAAASAKTSGLKSITGAAQPITAQEHAARIAKLQGLMQRQKVAAMLLDAGSTLQYFTGVQWWRSERTTAALILPTGKAVLVTPFFEAPSIAETLMIDADVRPWKEDESPFELLAGALRDQGAGSIAVEDTTRFFIVDRVLKAAKNSRTVVPGEDLVRACREIKSSAELALMQVANNVTIAALRHVHGKITAGMSADDIMNLMISATEALGGHHEFSSVLLNEASAFPHGSNKPQAVREGSVVLIDTGCTVHGYQSDITRSWVFGKPSARQRKVWDTVKRGQELALETAKLGVPCSAIDKAVRAFYEQKGWQKNYGLPGLSHRTGHGIGLDGHESPYLVRNDATPLAVGMCFSDEPGIYIPGEFGIRLEDCWHLTEAGPKLFTPLAKSLDEPV